MTFFLDHDVPTEIARILSGSGHDVVTLAETIETTATDKEVFEAATKACRILITCNRDDFLSLAKEHPQSGLIILIRRRTRIAEGAALLRLIDRAGPAGLEGNINFA